jgi:hypothetical protein
MIMEKTAWDFQGELRHFEGDTHVHTYCDWYGIFYRIMLKLTNCLL